MRRNRYFLMRHGESVANLADRIVSLPENGLNDFGLSDLGRQQAREQATASGLGADARIVASDFLRTRQTAEIAAAALGVAKVELDPSLRERAFGSLEGESGDDYKRVWAEDEIDPEHTLFGVESARRLAERLASVVERLENEQQGQTFLLVSHGDPLRFLQLQAAALPLTDHLKVRLFSPAEVRRLEDLPASDP